jgi:hypothetical protein
VNWEKQTQFKPNSNPIKANLSQFKPISRPIKAKTNPIFTLDVSSLAFLSGAKPIYHRVDIGVMVV